MGPLTDDELALMKQSVQDTQNLTGLAGPEQARLILQDALPEAARSLVQLALHADKESVRMQSTIHILDRGLGRVQDNPPAPVDDPWTELMQDCVREVVFPEHSIDPTTGQPLRPIPVNPGELAGTGPLKARQTGDEAEHAQAQMLDEVTNMLRALDDAPNTDMQPPLHNEVAPDVPDVVLDTPSTEAERLTDGGRVEATLDSPPELSYPILDYTDVDLEGDYDG